MGKSRLLGPARGHGNTTRSACDR